MPAPATAISELVLEARDLDAARRFYRDLLGLQETRLWERRDDRVWYVIGESARLGVWTPQEGFEGSRGGAHVHFALHVPAEHFDAYLAELHERGAELSETYVLGDHRAVYLHDPDGNVVELWTQEMADYAAGAGAARSRGRAGASNAEA